VRPAAWVSGLRRHRGHWPPYLFVGDCRRAYDVLPVLFDHVALHSAVQKARCIPAVTRCVGGVQGSDLFASSLRAVRFI
jgi:hypothetical protein